jgi:hypothetical protein
MTARFIALAVIVAGLLFAPASAPAEVGAHSQLASFSATPLSTQAGAHGDLLVSFDFDLNARPALPCKCNWPRDVIVNTPPGLVGFPTRIPRCTSAEFATHTCPADSQIGVVYIDVSFTTATEAVYNMVPHPGEAALVAFETPYLQDPPLYTSFTVRTESDFGLEAKSFGILRVVELAKVHLLLWGVPGDPFHDALRWPFGGYSKEAIGEFDAGSYQGSCQAVDTTSQIVQGINPFRAPEGFCSEGFGKNGDPPPTPYNATVESFLTNPTNCAGFQSASIDVLAYDLGIDHASSSVPGMTGCELLSFNPSLTAKPTTTQADSSSGLDVNLEVPQPPSPEAPSPSQIRATRMVLPEGFTVNSNAADGKQACTDQQARFGTREQAQCPEQSKIGTLAIHSSALPGVLPGALYLGEPQPGNRYRVFLTADGFSLHIKLAGRAVPNPETGQLAIVFENLPQAPFEQFTLHVFGGERGLLATPTQCGTYPVKTTFTPWDDALPEQTSTQFFTIDSGPGGDPCPPSSRPFAPSMSAGVIDSTAGAHTDFSLRVDRADGDQTLAGLAVTTPPGFSATLKGIPYCPQAAIDRLSLRSYSGLAEQASPACPAASQIGMVSADAGAGSKPGNNPGKVYLAGPYKGAPLSLLVVIPATAGPYDLGVVPIRTAIEVDPLTARVTAVSDPLPQILEGIPLRTRKVFVDLDRKSFVLNPTNCDRLSVDATVTGDQGASVALSNPFQVANCADLDYGPKLRLKLTGGIERRGHPAIHAVLTAASGEANSRRISVTLPKGELLDNGHIGTVCTRVAFAKKTCPDSSRLGRAEVVTPLLDQPLSGNAYLRSSSHELPDLVLDLDGQIHVEAVGRIDSVNARLRTTFEAIPDVPVSRITLDLLGGSKGLLQNSESLCAAPKRATVRMIGQNGRALTRHPKLQIPCGKSRRAR